MLLSKRHCKEYVCRIIRIRQREKSFNEFNHLKRDKSDIAIIPDRSVNDRYHKGSLFTKSRLHRGMKINIRFTSVNIMVLLLLDFFAVYV